MAHEISAVTEAHIVQAARMQSTDAAVSFLQSVAGITDGGVAALAFSGDFEWEDSSPEERFTRLTHWIEMERMYAVA